MRRRDWVWTVLGFSLSALFLWLALKDVSVPHVWESLKEGNVGLLAVAAGLNLGVMCVKSYRWKLLLNIRHVDYPFRGALATTFLQAAGNNVLPARMGELLRVAALSRFGPGATAAHGFGVNLIDRFLDVIALLALAVLLIPLPGYPADLRWQVLVGAALALGVLAYLRWYAGRRRHGEVPRFARRFGDRAREAAAHFLDGLALLRHPRVEAAALLLSAASWGLQILVLWLSARAFDHEVAPTEALLVLIFLNLAIALPSAPGSAGTFEYGATAGLVFFGADPTLAVAIALAFHAVNWFPVTLLGAAVALYTFALPVQRPAPR